MSPSEVTLGPFPKQPPRTVSTLHSLALRLAFLQDTHHHHVGDVCYRVDLLTDQLVLYLSARRQNVSFTKAGTFSWHTMSYPSLSINLLDDRLECMAGRVGVQPLVFLLSFKLSLKITFPPRNSVWTYLCQLLDH